MTNAPSNERFTSVCCKPDELDPDDSFCNRNGTFPVWEIFTTIFSNFSIAFVSREFNCNGTIFDLQHYPPQNDVFYLREDGAIYVNKSMYRGLTDYALDVNGYCFTSHLTEDGRKGVISVCDPFLGVVFGGGLLAPGSLINLIMVALTLPFLAATFLVYTILPELQNVFGFTLRANVASLFVASTLYLIIITNTKLFCYYPIALTMHFSIMAIFFWLNVMCFDIWWTFRRVRSVQCNSKHGNRRRCIMYSIYAWGSAAFVAGVGAIIDCVPTVPKGFVRPGLRATCWFLNPTAAVIYWIGPAGLTMICNICFFVLTTITMIRHKKDTANYLKKSDDNNEKERFNLHLKLFVVMGVTWLAEVVNWQWQTDLPEYVSYFLDLLNCQQGFSIFVIFVCKGNVKKLLLKRLGGSDKTVRPPVVELRPTN